MTFRSLFAPFATWAVMATASATTLEGQTLHALRAYPDVATAYGPAIHDTTVAAGLSDQVSWLSFLQINPEPAAMQISFQGSTTYIGAAGVFDGLVFSGFSSDLQSVSVSTNTTGLSYTLTHGLRDIAISFAGPTSGGLVVVDVALAPVPEPATAALIGLGLLVTLSVARRRA